MAPDCTRVGPGGPGSHAPPGGWRHTPRRSSDGRKIDTRRARLVEWTGQMRSQHMRAQLLVSLALFVALPGVAAAQRIEMDGRYWLPVIPGKLRVGPVLEAKGFVVEATLKAPATTPPLRETEKFAIALPSIGLAIDWSPHPVVDLFAEVSGLTLGDRGHVVDAEAGVRVNLTRFFAIIGGYRLFEVRGEEDSSFARLRLSGPFVGATLRF